MPSKQPSVHHKNVYSEVVCETIRVRLTNKATLRTQSPVITNRIKCVKNVTKVFPHSQDWISGKKKVNKRYICTSWLVVTIMYDHAIHT